MQIKLAKKKVSTVQNMRNNFVQHTLYEVIRIDINDPEALEDFKSTYYVTDEDIAVMQNIQVPEERTIQDYRSTYNDIRDWLRHEKTGKEKDNNSIDWDDVVSYNFV